MGSSPLAALPIPEYSGAKDLPSVISALAAAAEKKLILSFSTSTARDSTITSPVGGMVAALSTPQQLTQYDGTGWFILAEPAQAFTPAITGLTIGNGVRSGAYHRADGWLDFDVSVTLGTTSAVTGGLTLTLPIAASIVRANQLKVIFEDTGNNLYPGSNESGTTSVLLYAMGSAATYVSVAGVTASVPFAWGTGDKIHITGRYRMGSRYS